MHKLLLDEDEPEHHVTVAQFGVLVFVGLTVLGLTWMKKPELLHFSRNNQAPLLSQGAVLSAVKSGNSVATEQIQVISSPYGPRGRKPSGTLGPRGGR